MKLISFICKNFFLIALLFSTTQCKKNDNADSLNIVLYDKPLDVIQANITGNWKLQYMAGGLMYQKIVDKVGSYMILTPDHITLGNKTGVTTDSPIIWERKKNSFVPDSTYLLRYNYFWLDNQMISDIMIIYEIKNDTLVVGDNCYDGFSSCYTK